MSALSSMLLCDVGQLLFPSRCLVCARRIYSGVLCRFCTPSDLPNFASRCFRCFTESALSPGNLCEACTLLPLPFGRIRYLWPYADQAQRLIQIMKYRPSRALCSYSASRLASKLPNLFGECDWDLALPVPSSRRSLIQRGFNQCLLIADALLSRAQLPRTRVCPDALIHRGCASPQAALTGQDRLKNVHNSFSAKHTVVSGRRILLLDDVITTGATSAAAARALLEASAAQVEVLALARSETWQEYRYKLFQAAGRRS